MLVLTKFQQPTGCHLLTAACCAPACTHPWPCSFTFCLLPTYRAPSCTHPRPCSPLLTTEQAAAEDPLSLGGGYDYNWVLWSISKIRNELRADGSSAVAEVEVLTTCYLLLPTCYLLLTTHRSATDYSLLTTHCLLLTTHCLLPGPAGYYILPATYLLLAVYCSQADLNGDGYSFPGFPTTLYELLYGKEEGTLTLTLTLTLP